VPKVKRGGVAVKLGFHAKRPLIIGRSVLVAAYMRMRSNA